MRNIFIKLFSLLLVSVSVVYGAEFTSSSRFRREVTFDKKITVTEGVYCDTIISVNNSNAKIRYNSFTNKWQYTINGTTWFDFGSGGGSMTETDPIFSAWDKKTGIQITYNQITDFDTGVTSNSTVQSLVSDSHSHTNKTVLDNTTASFTTELKNNYDTAYSWGNHAGLYDTIGTASSLISSHTSTYDHTKLHDPASVNAPLSISGQQISLEYDTNTLDVSLNKLKVKDYVFSSFGHTHYLNDLVDVDTTGVADGKVLKYSSSVGKWVIGEDLQGSGSGSPGGSNTNIQYNDNGSFGGDSNLTWNKTSKTLTISGETRSETVIVTGSVLALPVLNTKPSAPSAGQVYVYYRNGAMYYQDSTGTETKMCETVYISGGSDIALYETDIVFNFNGSSGDVYTSSNPNYGRVRKAEKHEGMPGGYCYISTSDKKYGSGSFYTDGMGTGFFVQNPSGFDLLDDEWTFEAWIKMAGEPFFPIDMVLWGSGLMFNSSMSSRDCYGFSYLHDSNTETYMLSFFAKKNNSIVAYYLCLLSSGLYDNEWHHIAFVRDKSHNPQLRIFLDGVEKTVSTTTAFSLSIETTGYFLIGGSGDNVSGWYGYIDDFRFRRQKAYTENFTPPSEWQ